MSAAGVPATPAPLCPSHAAATAVAATAVGAGVLAVLDPSPLHVLDAGVAALLVWLAAIDLERRLVPNRIVLPAAAAVLLLASMLAPDQAAERVLAGSAAAGGLLLAAHLRPGDLGMGDVKLALLLGVALGGAVVTALAVGFGAVGLVGLVLVARSGRPALRTQLPLVPFLALGAVVALVLAG
jgi:leader peptidase (prepilin peptidase) / N-methyltransferase